MSSKKAHGLEDLSGKLTPKLSLPDLMTLHVCHFFEISSLSILPKDASLACWALFFSIVQKQLKLMMNNLVKL